MAAMAGADGDTGDHLNAPPPDLAGAEFFEGVRRLLDLARHSGARAASIGGDASPAREAVRLRAATGQRHLQAEIVNARAPADPADAPVDLTIAVMGLTGPMGVLPEHYTERVVERRRAKDLALPEFLDLFNHRVISLFWRAWAKYRLPVAFEADDGRLRDPFSRALAGLAGMGVAGEPVADEALLSMAGLLARRVRSPGALRRLVAGVFELPVDVIELQGRWVPIAADDRTRLGGGPRNGAFARLGGDAVLGDAVWDVGSRVRVRVGPLDLARFRSFFAPDGPRAAMTETIRRAVGGTMDFTIQLVLARAEVPALRLDDTAQPALLGQTTWLLGGKAECDREEALLSACA